MNNTDLAYFRLLDFVTKNGRTKHNRTGVDTIGAFGAQERFDLSEGFPLLTTKKIAFKSIVVELLWFLSGSTNIKYLVDNNVHIWDRNAYDKYCKSIYRNYSVNCSPISKELFIESIKNGNKELGELGEGTYGGMWSKFPYFINPDELGYVNQIQNVLNKLKTNPDDRRLIVSAWHPYWVDHCALPPCHCLYQFHTEELTLKERQDEMWKNSQKYPRQINELDETQFETHQELDEIGVPKRRLNLQMYQRSADLFLGVPFNIASYALLLSMVAQVSNMVVGEFVHTFGDIHIYSNHMDQINIQRKREPRLLPQLSLNPEIKNLFDFKLSDISIDNYNPHEAIKGEMAV